MKKIISLVLLLCIACACLVSCGASSEDFIENLGAGYESEKLDAEGIAELEEEFGIKAEDYSIVEITAARNDDNEIYIIECGSEDDAANLRAQMADYVAKYSKYGVTDALDGEFYIIGNKEAVDAAIGK